MTEIEALTAAKNAGDVAALAIWKRDEEQDRGSCGSAMLELDKRSKLFKLAPEAGVTLHDGYVYLPLPTGIRSQNADIPQAQYRAFKKVLEDAGYGKAIKRFWTYVD